MRKWWSAKRCKMRRGRAGLIMGAFGRHSGLDVHMQWEHALNHALLEVVYERCRATCHRGSSGHRGQGSTSQISAKAGRPEAILGSFER